MMRPQGRAGYACWLRIDAPHAQESLSCTHSIELGNLGRMATQ